MKRGVNYILSLALCSAILFVACENNTAPTFEDSIDTVVGLQPISGTENSKIKINKGEDLNTDSWFVFEIEEMQPNGLVKNGVVEGWCVEWSKPIQSDGTIHLNQQSYSTFGKVKWKPLNYFLSLKDQFKAEDPTLTFREIQATIWSLVPEPRFDLNKLSNEDLPKRLKDNNGNPAFSKAKVLSMINEVMNGVDSYEYKKNKPVAVFHDMGEDTQNGMTVETASETAWAVKLANGEVDDVVSKCFKDLDGLPSNKWGWTNGKFTEAANEQTLYLYTGAAQCDLNKGTLVGTFKFIFNNGKVDFKVEITETSDFTGDLFELGVLQIHIDNKKLPDAPGMGPNDFTAAPGQFDHIFDFDPMLTIFKGSIEDLSGDIYLAVHADVFGFDPDEDD